MKDDEDDVFGQRILIFFVEGVLILFLVKKFSKVMVSLLGFGGFVVSVIFIYF